MKPHLLHIDVKGLCDASGDRESGADSVLLDVYVDHPDGDSARYQAVMSLAKAVMLASQLRRVT